MPGKGRQSVRSRCRDATEFHQVGEKALEARRRNNLQNLRRFIASIPERLPLVARLKYQVPWAADYDVITEKCATLPSRT